MVLALNKVYTSDDVLIEMEHHGRTEALASVDVARTIGWFTSLYPVRIKHFSGDIAQSVVQVKETLRSVPRHGIGFGLLHPAERRAQLEQNWLRFNYMGQITTMYDSFRVEIDEIIGLNAMNNIMTSLGEINCFAIDDEINIVCKYNVASMPTHSMTAMIDAMVYYLDCIIRHCMQADEKWTPSDFQNVHLSQKDLDSLFL